MEELKTIVNALSQVKPQTTQIIMSLESSMSDMELAQSFNQKALDMFDLVIGITKRLGIESEYKISGYRMLFEQAVKSNVRLPLNNFYKTVLPFAPQIYTENVDYFLNMEISDVEASAENNHVLIRSEPFKRLWKNTKITELERSNIKDNIILLTTYSHAYFIKITK